jgi:hypothetical protein
MESVFTDRINFNRFREPTNIYDNRGKRRSDDEEADPKFRKRRLRSGGHDRGR